MSKLWRALLISAVATGVAAVVVKLIKPEAPPAEPSDTSPDAPRAAAGPYVDADTMTSEQQDLLLKELSGQV